MQWWNSHKEFGAYLYLMANKYFKGRDFSSLTGNEIEFMWKSEFLPEEKTETENIYLNRLKEQYIEVKRNFIPSENTYRQTRYNAMREFCLDTQLISFNDIELMESEINGSF